MVNETKKMKLIRTGYLLGLFLVLSLIINVLLLIPGKFPTGFDFNFHYQRILGLSKNIQEGNWVDTINTWYLNGFGYPVDFFYPNTFLLPAAVPIALGYSAIKVLRIYVFIITFLTFISTYYCVKSFSTKTSIGVIATVLWTASVYRLHDIFYRGGIGTLPIYIFLPIAFLGLYEIMYRNQNRWYLLLIGILGLLLCHLITCFVTVILIGFMMIGGWRNFKNINRIKALGYSVIGVVLLGMFYWLPLFEQMSSYNYFAKHHPVVELASKANGNTLQRIIFDSVTMNPFSATGLSIWLIAFPLLRFFIKDKSKMIKFADRLLIWSMGIIFLSSNQFPWQWVVKVLPFMNMIQYPQRFLPVGLLLLCVVSATYFVGILEQVNALSINQRRGLIVFVAIIMSASTLLVSRRYAAVIMGQLQYVNSYDIGAGKEYLPADVSVKKIKQITDKKTWMVQNSKQVTFDYLSIKGSTIQMNVTGSVGGKLLLPLIYYKGYDVDDSTVAEMRIGTNHFIELVLKKKTRNQRVRVFYKGTPSQLVANWLSGISLLFILLYLVRMMLTRLFNRSRNKD